MHVMVKDINITQTSYADREVQVVIGLYCNASEIHEWKTIRDINALSSLLEEAIKNILQPQVQMVRNKSGRPRPSLIIERDDNE